MRLIIWPLILIPCLSTGQNLVPNPGFEEFLKCPDGHSAYGRPIYIPNWFSPNTGTPDYFNECSLRHSKARINWAGRCEDFSGQGYAGIITYIVNLGYHEYLSVELLKPLDSGSVYNLQFSFRLSSYSKVSSGNIGLTFSNTPIKAKHDKVLSMKPALVAMSDSAIVRETGAWQIASSDYTAQGNERFIILGNFADTSPVYRIKFGGIHEPMLQNASYYYFDDVVVQTQVELQPELPVALEENPFETDSVIVLKNVQFAYNSAELNSNSEMELNRLFNFLNSTIETKIEIYGHTDDQGSDEYNRQLSLKRAKEVASYLEGKGIDSARLKYFGFGKSQPLINSVEEMAREINRRVEVKLVE